MRRPILAKSNGVVRKHKHRAYLHQRSHAQCIARVVGEREESAAKRQISAMQRDTVKRRAHTEFTHAEMHIVAGLKTRLKTIAPAEHRDGFLPSREVRTRQVRRSSQQFGQRPSQPLYSLLRCLTRRYRLTRVVGILNKPQRSRTPVHGQRSTRTPFELRRFAGVLPPVRSEANGPVRFNSLAALTSVPQTPDLRRNLEGRI